MANPCAFTDDSPENLREAVQVFKDDYHKISTGSVVEAHLVALTA